MKLSCKTALRRECKEIRRKIKKIRIEIGKFKKEDIRLCRKHYKVMWKLGELPHQYDH